MLESFEQSISRFPEVMECYLMTGDSDYLLRVIVRDTIELQHFIIERYRKRGGVANIRSSFCPQAGQIQDCASRERAVRLPS